MFLIMGNAGFISSTVAVAAALVLDLKLQAFSSAEKLEA